MEKNIITRLEETRYFINQHTRLIPRVGIITGSGLGAMDLALTGEFSMPYREIPHFVTTTVDGHPGAMHIGRIAGVPAVILRGRFHYYEGYTMEEITYPVRLLKQLGVELLIITAAAGSINPAYRPGDFVCIADHINFMGADPLRRTHYREFGERFPAMTEVYNKSLCSHAQRIAQEQQATMHEGVYIGVRGPSYETPAEVRAFRQMGADLVGMSVVPEAIVANQMGVQILGIAYIANQAAGGGERPVSHQEVIAAGRSIEERFGRLVTGIIAALPEQRP
jgi:purine-nucleoside phosphorylase